MNYIEVKAPSKINIGLYVTRKRNDGFHDIYTLFYPLFGLYDLLKFSLSDTFSFTCDNKSIPTDESNLIVKAVRALENISGKTLNLKIECLKNIPAGAGLGGGSSDAATTLLAVNELKKLNIPFEKLAEIALQLGSDVPFFLRPRPAIGESRGEKLTYVDLFLEKYFVLVNPGIHVSTGEVYSNITPQTTDIDIFQEIKNNNLKTPGNKINNVFQKYVYPKHPEMNNIEEKLKTCGAEYVQMSGSGSTIFGIFNNEPELEGVFPPEYLVKVIPPDETYY